MHKYNFVVVPQANVHFPKKGISLAQVTWENYNTSRIGERICGPNLTDVQAGEEM
jgi:hypothetical protein